MADQPPNPRIGAIERVGSDGFIVEATDKDDPEFYGGKRLFPNFDHLLRFLADRFNITKAESGYGKGNGERKFKDQSLPQIQPEVRS